jgi:zinc transport system permease protein
MLDIFEFGFMQRAFIAGLAIALSAPLIGMFLVVRRYSLMADTLAHVALVGVAIGVLTGTQPIVVAIVVSALASLGIERLRRTTFVYGESILALFLTGSLAVASLLFSLARGFGGGGASVNILGFLFGSITTVTPLDLVVIVVLSLVIVAVIALLYKELFLVSFDEEMAQAQGVRHMALNGLLVVLAGVSVSISMRVVGSLLIGALMVIPVITAMAYRLSFFRTMLLSVAFSMVAVVCGLFLSYYFDLASGGSIVAVLLVMFIVSIAGRKK